MSHWSHMMPPGGIPNSCFHYWIMSGMRIHIYSPKKILSTCSVLSSLLSVEKTQRMTYVCSQKLKLEEEGQKKWRMNSKANFLFFTLLTRSYNPTSSLSRSQGNSGFSIRQPPHLPFPSSQVCRRLNSSTRCVRLCSQMSPTTTLWATAAPAVWTLL